MRSSILLFPLFVLACTPDYDLGAVEKPDDGGPRIEVDPGELFFGTGEVGTELAQTFTITSIGDVTASVTEVQIDRAEFAVTSFSAGRLEVGDSMDVVITYTATGLEDLGKASVVSDDADSPHVVTLNGGGLVPDLSISPSEHDFGYVGLGERDSHEFALRNDGGATLEVTALELSESVFTYELSDSLPMLIEPGDERTVTVTFEPDDSSAFSGELVVSSNDPDGDEIATLNGSGAGELPIAVCSVTPDTVEAIHEDASWVGSGSYDPSGLDITNYDWTLVTKPSGSSARMPTGSGANRSNFTPDVVGTYVAELVVTNELGDVSEPCTATLEALPGGDLWIEIFWTHREDDMDLHLVRGSGRFESSDDCYYGNCVTRSGLDWGARGTTDNPILDIDDIAGTGPENINIDDPENGTFTAYVHDFWGSVYNGNNDVTMNIYIGGALEWTDTRNVNSEDHYEPFAEIEWPSGTVTSL